MHWVKLPGQRLMVRDFDRRVANLQVRYRRPERLRGARHTRLKGPGDEPVRVREKLDVLGRSECREAVHQRDADLEGLTFHDLRATAVTRWRRRVARPPEIATLTGHSLKHVESILGAHYPKRESSLGVTAIRKRGGAHKAGTKIPN